MFNRQQLKADAFLCIQGRVEEQQNPSPHTSDTCAQGTRGKTASVGRKPAVEKEQKPSKQQEMRAIKSQTGDELTYLVYYILKEHREGQGRVF